MFVLIPLERRFNEQKTFTEIVRVNDGVKWEVGSGKRGGGLGSRPKKMYGERLGDGVEYHLMKPTPRR